MRGRRAALIALTAMLAVACGREGLIATRTTNAPPPRLPPIAIPESPQRDGRPIVWTQRSDKSAIRVVMTPREPLIGEDVRFDIKMSYGEPPYRPGAFNYRLRIEEAIGESAIADCAIRSVPVGFRPPPPKPFDDNLRRSVRFYEPGPHTFSLEARTSCGQGGAGVSLERTFSVLPARPMQGLRLTGSDGQRQADLLMSPGSAHPRELMHFFAIFEDRTREPFSWRVSFGDGNRPIVGGSACKRGTAAPDGRYERRFAHRWDWPAEYRVLVELSPTCLTDSRSRGAIVIYKNVYVRPDLRMLAGGVRLPSHRFPPIHAKPLGPVTLVVDDERCVYLERGGERLQVLWPTGYWLMRKPIAVSPPEGFPRWRAGKVRKDVIVLGSADTDAIPERCRTGDRAVLLGPLTGG